MMNEMLQEIIADNCAKSKYAMYLRKSRADLEAEALGEGETLARHRNILSNLASKMEIHPDQIVEYHEIVSGDSIAERPQMQRLLNDVYQKKYKGVMVVEVERLARGNTKDQGEVADAFQYSNTQIITPSKVYNPNNEFDQEYFEFGLFMSRREYKTIKRRMEAGRMGSVEEGNYVGSLRPYGYNIERINKKERILVINETEGPVVKMIFDWFTVDKQSAGWIARKLTEMQIPTLTGNKEWNRGTVADILRNHHYTGMVRWNRRRCSKEFNVENSKLSKTKRRLTPDDFKIHPGKHKAIISQEQFDLAQTLFSGIAPVKANETIANPLAGLLFCKDCKKALFYQKYPTRPKTEPRYAHSLSVLCKKKSLAESIVIGALVSGLKAFISDYEMKMDNEHEKEEVTRHQVLIDSLEKELDKQEKKRRKLFEAFEDGVYTNEEFIERKQVYSATVEELKKQVREAKENAPKPVDYEEKIIQLHKLIDCITDPTIEAKRKNDFLKTMIDRIEYDVIDFGKGKGGQPILDIFLK